MAQIEPLHALRYDLDVVGDLQRVLAPPYDVIDPAQRAELAARSPYNVVGIDLPDGDDPYAHAAELLAQWQADGAVVRDEPALWILDQAYVSPDGQNLTRRGVLAAVKVEEYGPGRIRPHERTHPGPKEDRLRLTRATKANLSPIFSLYSDATGGVRAAMEQATAAAPWATATDDDDTRNTLWRVDDPDLIGQIQAATSDAELLIADGHHRYETARVYAEEVGGDGAHTFVLMCLVALEDPGLTVFPTHRLVGGLADRTDLQEGLRDAIKASFDIEPVDRDDLVREDTDASKPVQLGYLDTHHNQPYRLTLKDQAVADAALPEHSEAYRRLDTAVLEALLLKGALEFDDDRISHLDGLGYSRSTPEALEFLDTKQFDAGFFMGFTAVEQIQAVAAAGESMPPKSTYFYPKVPTGLLFNPLA